MERRNAGGTLKSDPIKQRISSFPLSRVFLIIIFDLRSLVSAFVSALGLLNAISLLACARCSASDLSNHSVDTEWICNIFLELDGTVSSLWEGWKERLLDIRCE